MANGLFQSARQMQNQQFADDVALDTGIFSQIGGSLGRALSGSVDPRITLAKEMQGLNARDPKQLAAMSKRAFELGLPEQAFAIADRIREATPKAVKRDVREVNGQLVEVPLQGDAFSIGDFSDDPDAFGDPEIVKEVDIDGVKHVVVGQRDKASNKLANQVVMKADEFRSSKSGGSGGKRGALRFSAPEMNALSQTLNKNEKFEAIDKGQFEGLVPMLADAKASLQELGLTAAEAERIVVEAAEGGLVKRDVFDVRAPDGLDVESVRASLVNAIETRRGASASSSGVSESPAIQQARAWLAANPNDPRAAAIRQQILDSQAGN